MRELFAIGTLSLTIVYSPTLTVRTSLLSAPLALFWSSQPINKNNINNTIKKNNKPPKSTITKIIYFW